MQKKDDKVSNKTANKKKGKGKKQGEREKKIETDRQKKLMASAYAWKTKKPFDYLRLVGKYAFFVAKFICSHCYAN